VSEGAPTSVWRTIRLVAVVAVLLFFSWVGLKEGFDGYGHAENGMQRFGAVTQLLYGTGAVAALFALWRHASWLKYTLIHWGVWLTATGGLAPVVWGGSEIRVGLMSGAATALLAALVGWGALAHERSHA
jgi:hypothetical protein